MDDPQEADKGGEAGDAQGFFARDLGASLSGRGDSSSHLVDEFVSQDAETLDVSSGGVTVVAGAASGSGSAGSGTPVVDADPGLESLILSDPAIAGSAAAEAASGAQAVAVTTAAGNPILLLSQDQMSTLENVLQSEEAKGMLDVLEEGGAAAAAAEQEGEEEEAGEEDLMVSLLVAAEEPGDVPEELGGGQDSAVAAGPQPSDSDNNAEEGGSSSSADPSCPGGGTKRSPPKRRSQRQMDREMKEEAERIRMENQARMKKEREEAEERSKKLAGVVVGASEGGSGAEETDSISSSREGSVVGGRPKRERKIPAHLKSGDFESAFVDKQRQQAMKNMVKTSTDSPQEVIRDLADAEQDSEASTQPLQPLPEGEGETAGEDDGGGDDLLSDDNSEDDPERLWCICKQPHNNRFMICCDTCLEWFHGKCVGISKDMGKEMEEAGNEWRCPKCKEDREAAQSELKRKELAQKLKEREEERKKRAEEMQQHKEHKAKKKLPPLKRSISSKEAAQEAAKAKPKNSCFVCDNPPREQSIYCRDECIVKHARKAKEAIMSDKSKQSLSSSSAVSPSATSVMVMDPRSNTMLTGPSAPSAKNLESWLLRHPTYYAAIGARSGTSTSKFYGSAKRHMTNRKPKIVQPHKQLSQSEKSSLVDQRLAEYKQSALSSLSAAREKMHGGDSAKRSLEKRRSFEEPHYKPSSSSSARDYLLQQPLTPKKEPQVRKTPVAKGETIAAPPPPADPKPVRQNALKGIEEALRNRIKKCDDVTVEESKLRELVRDIEEKLFRLYNKDVGPKYKNKYRSLVFNIRDEKNSGLFRKIVGRRISPRELVAMSAEEMANKELQQWRQQELKHDIDMIKANELDQLARGTKFVVKSHKGEEIIGDAKEGSKEGGDKELVKLPDDIADAADKDGDKKTKIEEKEDKERRRRDKDKRDKHRHSGSSSSSKHHSSSRSRHRSSKSDDKSQRHRHNHSSSASPSSSKEGGDRKRHRHSSSSREGSSSSHRRHSSSTSKSSHRDKDKSKVSSSSVEGSSKDKASIILPKEDKEEEEKRRKEKEEEERRQKEFSEQVAKAERVLSAVQKSMEQAIPLGVDLDEGVDEDDSDVIPVEEGEEPTAPKLPPSPRTPNQQEVTSTVTIKTPETEYDEKGNPTVWKGDIEMPDVAKFSVKAQAVSGTTDYLTVDLKNELKIVGRIPPKIVWDYIEQLNEAQTKEILLIRLQPSSDDDKGNYESFFSYLQGRKRFGVVGNNSFMVKDCYILPLAAKESLHDCLLPCDGPGLDDDRPNSLLALVVRSKRKRPGAAKAAKKPHTVITLKKKSKRDERSQSREMEPAEAVEDEYDPAMAGEANLDLMGHDESPFSGRASGSPAAGGMGDDDVYDPESAFEEAPHAKRKKVEEGEKHKPITSSSGGFTEELAKLTKEIEKQKAELASIKSKESEKATSGDGTSAAEGGPQGPGAVKGFQGLPNSIANILFGGEGSSSEAAPGTSGSASGREGNSSKSSLSKMSDADLLAKAQEMEGMTGPPPSAPQPSVGVGGTPPPFGANQQSFGPDPDMRFDAPPPAAAPYSDPNWMNTGPPPLPPVPVPPQFHMGGGSHPPQGPPPGPWMEHQVPPPMGGRPPPWQHQQQQQDFHGGEDWPQQHHRDQEERQGGWYHGGGGGGGGGNWRGDQRDYNRRRGGGGGGRRDSRDYHEQGGSGGGGYRHNRDRSPRDRKRPGDWSRGRSGGGHRGEGTPTFDE